MAVNFFSDAIVNGSLTVTSGTSGDATLIISADTDNSEEGDSPRLWFKADGDIIEGAIQHKDNTFDFISNVSSSGGFRFLTGTTNNTGTTDPETGATERMSIASDGVVTVAGALQPNTIELGHASDTTIARSAAGTVTIEGNKIVTENKQLHTIPSNFFDDIGTIKHYIPISSQSLSEQTGDGNTVVDFLVPCSTKVKEVMVKLPSNTTGSGDLTVGIETANIGATPSSKSIIETETVTIANTNDNDIVHFMFDDTTHATIGQNLSISIQATSDLSGSASWYVVTILEYDWSTRHTGSSAVQTS